MSIAAQQAKQELDAEMFREAVEREKARLRWRHAVVVWLRRLNPFASRSKR